VHLAYPVRPGDDNDELRYSLRSLRNLPDVETIWIVGHKPEWLKGVEHLDGNPCDSGPVNVYANIRTICEHPDLPPDVLMMNDDFYITRPVGRIPAYYRGTLTEHINLPRTQAKRGWWLDSLTATRTCLQAHGIPEPISYELHIPMKVNRADMADSLAMMQHVTPDNPPQWRSIYGNLSSIGGRQRDDVKTYGPAEPKEPFHSTQDRSFRHARPYLERLFPDPSQWEIPA
jgi:hypothetical protein